MTEEKTAETVSKTTTVAQTQPATDKFTPIADLFKESWNLMTAGALNAILVSLISLVAYVVTGAVAVGAFFGMLAGTTDLSTLFSNLQEEGPTALAEIWSGGLVGGVVGIAVISSVVFMLIGATFSAALLFAFAWAHEKPTIGKLIQSGFKVSGWFILYGLVAGLLSFGGFWFFVLPALLMGLFFGFGMYEVVLGGKKPFAALKNSVTLVAENFGAILGRVLIFFLINVVVSYLLPAVFNGIDENVGAIYGIINMVFSVVISWFGVAYMVTLYRQAVASTPRTAQRGGLLWTMISLSILGWIGFVIMSSFLINLASNYMKNSAKTPADFENYQYDEEMMLNDMMSEDELENYDSNFVLPEPAPAEDETGRIQGL